MWHKIYGFPLKVWNVEPKKMDSVFDGQFGRKWKTFFFSVPNKTMSRKIKDWDFVIKIKNIWFKVWEGFVLVEVEFCR